MSAPEPAPSYLLWHATPLHYVPYLLATGALLSQARLAAEHLPVRPRPTAAARVRRLGLAGYVHLSLSPRTPLLADKRGRGWPHVLLQFPANLLEFPGVSLLKYNTKAWRHRDDFVPVTNPEGRAALLEEHRAGRYPSLEVLIPDRLPLSAARALHAPGPAELELVHSLGEPPLALPLPETCVSPDLFPLGAEADLDATAAYFRACAAAGRVLPPPDLPFD